ncbi:hypothetical protein [Vibrio sonorensis]|uniref:hypothetical protein n=1 Tax=Vibrio sonorensis TaxID=1004316 RepID=UPI000B050B16|nr:hypothetical protein [Vibrio sonorensis]
MIGRLSIRNKIILAMFTMGFLLFVIAVSVQLKNRTIEGYAIGVGKEEIPKVTMALSMLDELGDMNSNVLEFITGEIEEKEDFTANYTEFVTFFENLRQLDSVDRVLIRQIDDLSKRYYDDMQNLVFKRFDPSLESKAVDRYNFLVKEYAEPLELLLDTLKEEEVEDAGRGDFEEVVNDDLPVCATILNLSTKKAT